MKLMFASLALLPLLASAPATAAVAPRTAAVLEVPSLRARFNAAVDALKTKAAARQATRADYQAAVDALTAAAQAYEAETPLALSLRERVRDRINQLEIAAQTAMYDLLELDILKDQAIDVELGYALARLKARAASGKAEKTDWDAVAAALVARADAAKAWNPEIDAIIGRLRTEIDSLMARAKTQALKEADFKPAEDIAIESRVSMVIARLEKRGLEKKAFQASYTDVHEIAKFIPVADNADLVKRVAAKLEEIKALVAAGKITREEYVKLRDMLMIRARAASSPK